MYKFDATGTLTSGEPAVIFRHVAPGNGRATLPAPNGKFMYVLPS
jgi:hypothetical protein